MHYLIREVFRLKNIKGEDKVKEIKAKEISLRDNLANEYDAQISDYQHKVEINTVLKKLYPQKRECILDLGCGTGRITYKLIELGCKVVGVDFSKESLKVCERRCSVLNNKNNLYLIRADVCNLPLKDGYFDKCVSAEVFEQIPTEKERLKMLREVKRVLRLNGKLVLTTYNYSLRKIMGRKRETHSNNLYFYRYDYFRFKKIISTVFRGKIKIVGILNFRHWIPTAILNIFKKVLIPIDNFIEKTPVSYLLAHLLSVECKKTNDDEYISDKETANKGKK